MRRGPVVAVLAAVALLAACSTTEPGADPAGAPASVGTSGPSGSSGSSEGAGTARPSAAPSSSASDPGPTYSDWDLGAHVLPEDDRGFGAIRPTPKPLRHRLFPTVDLLPAPTDGAFHSSVGPVTPAFRTRMGETWSPSCPVGLEGLRHLTVTFRGFDGQAHTGELVVAAGEAEGIVSVFRALFAADYPIEEMRLPTTADLDAPPTGDGNNTAALVCRTAVGSTTLSAHASGLAIDVNPFLNPYLKGDLVLPERASAYLDRSRRQPGIIHADDLVVREFARIGWSWGGAWRSLKDYQHFSATGR